MSLRIVTSYICPPIPDRSHDWCAHYDGEEEAGGYGYGRTEAEAIEDFRENCQEHHDNRLGLSRPIPSAYLSPEASAERIQRLCHRLASEAIWLDPAGITWLPESDYWKIPPAVQALVQQELLPNA